MNTLIALFMLLGSTFARRGRGFHCGLQVEVTQQDIDLEFLLAPFLGSASDVGEDTEEGSDGETGEAMDVPKTTCVMRGLSAEWPHEDAVNAAERRLLRRGTRSRVAFNVTDGAIGFLSKKTYDQQFTCYNGGEVSLSFTSAVMTKSTGEVVTFPTTSEDPRRMLRRGGNGDSSSSDAEEGSRGSDSSEDEDAVIFPTAVLTFTQLNNFGEADASFPVSVMCRPWYKFQRSEQACALNGLVCGDGEYIFNSVLDDEVHENEEWFGGMKCIANDEHFLSRWEECAAPEEH